MRSYCEDERPLSFSTTDMKQQSTQETASRRMEKSQVRPSAGGFEVFTTSLSSMAPTFVLSFTPALVAQSAGQAVPLAFLAGGGAVAFVAWCFIAFSRKVTEAGSAMAYVQLVFGVRTAFLTGWAMLLAYVTLTAAAFVMAGTFSAQALHHLHLGDNKPMWAWIGAAAAVMAAWVSSRRLYTAAHIMLVLETVSILAILGLAAVILSRQGLSLEPLRLDPHRGLPGIGSAMAFSILAFTGFETATTLSEETRKPTRSIPRALFGSVLAVTGLYFFVAYVQVVGYGHGGGAKLAAVTAPLDDLASTYLSERYGLLLDAATAVSAFGCTVGFTTATARLLYALGRGGLNLSLTVLDKQNAAPRRAIVVVCVTSLSLLVFFGAAGRQAFTDALLMVGTLSLIGIYLAVCIAHAVGAARLRCWISAFAGWVGGLLLVWPLSQSVFPVPTWPMCAWPWLVVAWVLAGGVLLEVHPRLKPPRPAALTEI